MATLVLEATKVVLRYGCYAVLAHLVLAGVRQFSHAQEGSGTMRIAQNDAARRLEQKLDNFDPCAKELSGVDVPGFKLACRTMTTGGTTLGSVPVIYMLGSVQECAAKCRPVGRCTAFSFNKAEDSGRHRCEIFGGSTRTVDANSWISGRR